MTRFASGAAPWSPQHPSRSLAFLSPSADIRTQKEKRHQDQREAPTCTMTETTKTHVILLACGSFNPITKGHIQMFGESSRPPSEAASASLLSPAPGFSRATELGGEWPFGGVRWLTPLVGSPFLYSGLPGGDADCAFQACLALARPGLRGPRGGGGEGRKVCVGLDWVEVRRTGVRMFRALATWLKRIGMRAEAGRGGGRRGTEITCCLFRLGAKLEGVK